MEKVSKTYGMYKYRVLLSNDDIRTIRFLYDRGKTIREIAELLKIPTSTLFRHMKKNNVRTRKGSSAAIRQKQRDSIKYSYMIGKNACLQPVINRTTGAVYASIKKAAECLFINYSTHTSFRDLSRTARIKGVILERGEKYIRNH